MLEHSGEDTVIVARVRLALANGSHEEWHVPMQLSDDALSFTAPVYPPAGATVVSVETLERPRNVEQEIVVARADVSPP